MNQKAVTQFYNWRFKGKGMANPKEWHLAMTNHIIKVFDGDMVSTRYPSMGAILNDNRLYFYAETFYFEVNRRINARKV